jgi:hypothetical protein
MKTLILLAISILSSSIALCGENEPANPTRWEYKIWRQPDDVSFVSRQREIEKQLNALGAEGWELVTVMWKKHSDRTSPNGRAIYYFKRSLVPKKNAEQGGADQPATAPGSKSEGEEKPKSESKGRPQ